jgi:pilus assembly protein CpaC
MRAMPKHLWVALLLAAGLGGAGCIAWAQTAPDFDNSGAAGALPGGTPAPGGTVPGGAVPDGAALPGAEHVGVGVPAPASANLPPAYFGSIDVAKGSGKLVKLPRAVGNLFIADSSVAEVRPASPGTMFVFGKAPGETDIVATDSSGNRIAQYTVTVDSSDYMNAHLQSEASSTAPGSNVHVDSEANGVVVSGTVNSAEEADTIMNQAKAMAPSGTVTNNLNVNEPVQVELKVRIAQMSRNVSRELGIDWGAATANGFNIGKFTMFGQTASAAESLSTVAQGQLGAVFPGGTFEGVVDALAADNLAHILAEPTLTTLSGTQASFQVGGQFPIPTSSSGSGSSSTITVTWKNYGVLLTFTPTVFSDGRIALQVAPELSSINSANSAIVSSSGSSESLAVPSINITTTSSTVILGSGQGMAIAGLLEDNTNEVTNGVPGLSEVPLLGALFRGDAFQREQQELVITVTPYIVQPTDNPNSIASPDDGWTPPNDLQRILLLHDNGTTAPRTSIPGDAGFMVQ